MKQYVYKVKFRFYKPGQGEWYRIITFIAGEPGCNTLSKAWGFLSEEEQRCHQETTVLDRTKLTVELPAPLHGIRDAVAGHSPASGPAPGEEVVKDFITLWLIAGSLFLGCAPSEDRSRHVLDDQGFTAIEITGIAFFGCGKDDMYFGRHFTALNPRNQVVQGTVCCGMPLPFEKGCTVRF